METLREQLDTTWTILEEPSTGDEVRVRELTSLRATNGPILLGVDDHGYRHLLFPIGPTDARVGYTGSRGIQLVRRAYVDDGVLRAHLDLECRIPRLRRLFTIVVADLLDRARDAADDVGELLAALRDWRRLLEQADSEISESTVRGAFGELWQLRKLCEFDARLVTWWRGPRGESQDIVGPGHALEVKSTSRPGKTVQINGLGQLDSQLDLYLIVQTVRDDATGEGLAELLAALARCGADVDHVHDGLGLLGIDPDDDHVRQLKFSVADERWYRVTGEFPRLVTSDLLARGTRKGVDKLSYRIDLEACTDYAVGPIAGRQEVLVPR